MSEATSGKPTSRLHLKFEIGGDLLGKGVAVNYGLPAAGPPELSGILIGKREPSRVLIVSFRSMDLRSEEAEANLEDWERAFGGLMARVRWDPSLAGLKPVGWFRSHPKSPLSLSQRDLDLFNRFFPEPWQVGVALRPGSVTSTGRFFLREPDGLIRAESGFQDFVVRRTSDRSQVYVGSHERPVGDDDASLVGFDQPPRRTAVLWPATIVLITAASGLGAWWILRPPQTPHAPSALNQSVTPDLSPDATQRAETLWKQWQAEAKAQQLQGAPAPPANPDLPPPAQNSPLEGSRKSDAEGAADRALDAKRREIKPDARQNAPQTKPDVRQSQLEAHLETKPPANSRPAPASEAAPATSSQVPAPAPPQVPARRAENLPSTPPPQPLSPSSNVVANERPSNESAVRPRETPPPAAATTAAGGLGSALLPSSASSAATAPSAPTGASNQKPVVAAAPHPGPSSGRVIWTGRLRKNEVLILGGDKPSTGSVSGSLPGQPITFNVSPGDLTKDGLVVYTALQPHAGSTQEPPGPQNGWNKTTYDWDPNRAADLEVMEAPGPNNGWKRLVLRSHKTRNVVVMVEWKRQS